MINISKVKDQMLFNLRVTEFLVTKFCYRFFLFIYDF